MLKKIITLLLLICFISMSYAQSEKKKQIAFQHTSYVFKSAKEQADSLTHFMNKAIKSGSSNKQFWEHKLFSAFPNSFTKMESLFGYTDKLGAAPLYSTGNPSLQYMNKRIYNDVIGFFSELKSIPNEFYYEKYTNINIDGNWQADNIQEAFGLHYKLLNDTENVCVVLSKYGDKEIKSVFRFIFDGPHPKNKHNEEVYKKLKSLLNKQYKKLGRLLTESYEKLIKEDDGHNH